ncbi:hypothetical protein EFA46_011970 (plasmid) [Halarchaeum sp. CBA1220]|uniref:hypothetical protein n=1 Tax=Halarchaeum sp. CBA1220 TaxID=1853682 RepID=UPI000F3AA3F0|nr:hypothetical protein [Halarchaeum sp. CBA1220]QLC34968.1 hypothetical protein EFA46_011970 [Halarchaeum sp. CBA1220]
MVSSAVVAVLGTLAGAALSAGVTIHTTRVQEVNQNQRRQAEYLIEKKVDRLTELHESFTRCRATLAPLAESGTYAAYDREDEREFDEMVDEYHRSIHRARIFVSDRQFETLLDALLAFQTVTERAGAERAEEVSAPILDDDRSFRDVMAAADEVLREELHEPVRALESE